MNHPDVNPDVVTLGETMALIAATGTGPFAVGSAARISFAGAESNVAIGMARLGHRVAFVGRLGADPLGQLIHDALRGEGIDVSAVRRDDDAPTALILREHRTADRVRVSYYRKGLAGSRLQAADLDAAPIGTARILHVTGITPALSDSARACVHRAVELATNAGVTVSLDVNYRAALWSKASAASELSGLVERADVVFAGTEEAELVVGSGQPDQPEQLARELAKRGPAEVVVKLGEQGALALVDDEIVRAPGLRVSLVDPVGAGDAFVAGYLSAWLDGLEPRERLVRGNVCGAFAVSVEGDWEGLPRRPELATLFSADNVGR